MLTSLNSLPLQTLFRVIVAFSAVVITLLAIRLIEPTEARNVVRYGGYFFTLVGSAGLAVYLVLSFRSLSVSSFCRNKLMIGIWSVLVGSWVLFVHADFGYKLR